MRNQLSDGRITIRRYHADDIAPLFEVVRESMTEISVWMDWCHAGYSIEESREWVGSCNEKWESGEEYNFVIADAATNKFLGGTGLNVINRANRFANLGYWVRTAATGRGVATAAARLVACLAFEDLELRRAEIIAAVGNLPSRRVAEKTGAQAEGILRNRLLIRGQSHNAAMYSLVPEDLKL